MTRPLLLATLILLGACGGDETTGPGQIDVAWTGADTGRLEVPATARWCASDSMVQVVGAAGDSGVALAVMPRDSVAPGTFPVGVPRLSRPRPAARVGLRWLGETMVEGYYSLSGTVTVDPGAQLNGSLEATLRNINDGGEISLSGTFRQLSIQPGTPEFCGAGTTVPSDSGMQ